MSKCPGCGIEKSVENTYRDKGRRDGLSGICKACAEERKATKYRDWYLKYNSRRQVAITSAKLKKYICIVCGIETESVRHRVTCGSAICIKVRTKLCSLAWQKENWSKGHPECIEGCGRKTSSKSGICRFCVSKRYKEKKDGKKIFSCRLCGGRLQNRGLHYDFCYKCVPRIKSKIGYCQYCGMVVHGSSLARGKICNKHECQAKYSRVRAKKSRKRAAEYKNSLKEKGCIICGYSKCLSALEFHHIGGKKDLNMSGTTSMTKIRNEIEKNDLIVLCANCHREVHAGMVDDLELTRKSIFLSGAQLCLV